MVTARIEITVKADVGSEALANINTGKPREIVGKPLNGIIMCVQPINITVQHHHNIVICT